MKNIVTSQSHIQQAFDQDHAALMPYFTLGYPDFSTSLSIVEACAKNGANLMELGIPFSDPLADGPTIQSSSQVALENGTTVENCLQGVAALRERGLQIPFMLMGYYNPILAYGLEKFAHDAHNSGADGLIIPDLPPEEAGPLRELCDDHDLTMTFLIAPNSPAERIDIVASQSTGFIYLVSVTGTTGARRTISDGLEAFVERVRARTQKPLAVGFGISTPEQAVSIGRFCDGVIVGSALIRAVQGSSDPVNAAGVFTRTFAEALEAKPLGNKRG